MAESQHAKGERGATAAGTASYKDRFDGQVADGHFRQAQGLTLSSIGLGSYLGEADDRTDDAYRNAVKRVAELGCNVFDTAANYRCQRSERSRDDSLNAASHGSRRYSPLGRRTRGRR